MREQIQKATREALARNDKRRVCTLRLINAAIKDRDRASRERGGENISESEVTELLSTMVRQRQASAREFEDAGRADAAEDEREEIAIIREFLPAQVEEPVLERICSSVVSDIGAHSLRDVGRTMSALKERYPGQLDFGRASCLVKNLLR